MGHYGVRCVFCDGNGGRKNFRDETEKIPMGKGRGNSVGVGKSLHVSGILTKLKKN